MTTKIQKFGKGSINMNGTLIHYFRVRVSNNEMNKKIFSKYDVNYIETSALKKYKHNSDKIQKEYLEINIVGTDYAVFFKQELNIYRALREIAMQNVENTYSFILDMTNSYRF